MHVVLVNPLIPQNTGSIARTCAATGTELHLVGKLGFDISEKAVRRAGLDYWPHVNVTHHASWEAYSQSTRPRTTWLIETSGTSLYYQAEFSAEDAIVFGSETIGLPEQLLAQVPASQVLRIPISCEGVRSLNLSNAVAIVLYEARRQLGLDEGAPKLHSKRAISSGPAPLGLGRSAERSAT